MPEAMEAVRSTRAAELHTPVGATLTVMSDGKGTPPHDDGGLASVGLVTTINRSHTAPVK